MPVVRKVEACGSSSGRTRQAVVIADCGELPTRRQVLAKLAAEKQALADMKKDVIQVGQLFRHDAVMLLRPADVPSLCPAYSWQGAAGCYCFIFSIELH